MGNITIDGLTLRPTSELYVAIPGDAGEAMEIGHTVHLNGSGAWAKTDASTAAGVGGTIGLVISGAQGTHHMTKAIASGERIGILLFGEVFLGESVDLDEQETIYLSEDAGLMADEPPTNFRAVATPTSPNTILWNPVATQPGS